ncbi:multidrug efflux RND transporter permease AcrD [Klebsiella quasipneumoniae subsp. similipneumoniae]|uniref:multidrug efflux RND transporter permease AcrD n=1 Tax=Klebsiella quasipneumoniae TaxID=1463165 RepID=UPI000BE7662B|nr:multidrug efflux RND transporter permease AcrD [Klebsiella quasipneumoniae]EKW7951397.1 multidrug efflux RND transporter permease AcrD [Klebsiella quasipneumoniae]MBF7804620.1 multidrug efflux RND transporter permease AcrD [Klebsiella quasipneumoniae]MCJ1853098.1 multidrug efflux RND transporter permease AcrD [Klebsiella quasipneumoniae subsp. similipneumoniae]PDP95087.1 aminoglycoside/multidrug transporter subunit AcrD [Klebsiella quasipneumoniae]PLC98716.1 aminoglycoside/multidrug transpo
MANFFIDRPIFAWVLAILLCLTGTLAILSLPVEQYPDLAPPNVRVTANYPGASAQTLENTVTQVIEQNMTGLDNLMYMSSQSSATGQATITLSFTAGTDPDEAVQQVQNQLQSAMRKLPQAVQNQGVTVRKTGDTNILTLAFVSTDGSMDKQDIADYVASNIQDPLSRVNGVGDIDAYGSQYSMRIWLDPAKLNSFQLTTKDVTDAISSQNAQIAVGQLGGTPSVDKQALNATINAQSLLQTPEQFRNITLRVNQDGSEVTLGDVATVEMGAEKYDYLSRYNRQAASGLGIKLASGANEMATAERVIARLNELSQYFPHGLEYKVAYETTSFVKASITDVVKTLLEAILLVFLVMYLFLQNFRATLIPTIAVPVVLMGTFAVLYACGYSINTLTMFAMVLAIGLLVDDAIVVVENVERIMSEEGLSPREATRKSMGQIQGALVGIAMVLSAVFVPMAFFGGTTGAIYRQFSITIVAAMVLSVLVAMILTPALCATLLKPIKPGESHERKGFFGWFNRTFNRSASRYETFVGKILHRSLRWMLIYIVLLGGMVFLFLHLPTSFLPLEDRGMFTTSVQLPSGSTQQQTLKVVQKAEDYFLNNEKQNVESVFATVGSGPGGNGQNVARMFVRLKDWDQRDPQTGSSFAIIERATKAFNQINEARVIASSPPAISGLGSSAGFDMELEDHAGKGHDALMAARDTLLELAAKNPLLTRVRHNGLDDSPQLQVDIDQRKAQALGVSIDDINDTLQTAWGSSYVNDFMDRGRVKKVYVQAAAKYRMLPDDINLWYVRNSSGTMVPFSAFATSHWETGSPRLERYNGYSAVEIVGEAVPGISTGTAMDMMEKLAAQLPTGFGLEWTAMSYQERLSGAQAPALYAISLLVVFLCLAALYESWSVPFSVMLVVPLGVIGALLATWMRGLENDVYFQVGLLTVIGLSAKNAILIVEFANELNEKGQDLLSATLSACRQRLRPILMTSLAFIFGVLPMATSTGAGSGSQHAVGTGVMGGMISATVLAIFFVPLFFVLVRRRFPLKERPQ